MTIEQAMHNALDRLLEDIEEAESELLEVTQDLDAEELFGAGYNEGFYDGLIFARNAVVRATQRTPIRRAKE